MSPDVYWMTCGSSYEWTYAAHVFIVLTLVSSAGHEFETAVSRTFTPDSLSAVCFSEALCD